MGGCLLMVFLSIQSGRATTGLLNAPGPNAAKMIEKMGSDNVALLLHHAAAQQVRDATSTWEKVELALSVVLGGCLYLATQRRAFPLVLCGVMLVLVMFQHFGISPELAYRGLQTDFPPGNAEVGEKVRFLAMQEVFYAAEIVKLVVGGILASYLFVFRTSRRRKDVDLVDHADHRRVNR
jgi:hypothetical protein